MWPMIAAAVAKQAIGGKQLGGMAPAPSLGGGSSDFAQQLSQLAQQNNFGHGGMIGGLPQAMQNLPQGDGAKVNEKKTVEAPEQSGFGKFFGNIDSTLSSPSKTLGIGALGQIDPKLALAGLLASGFWNQQ